MVPDLEENMDADGEESNWMTFYQVGERLY
jgi:hypothetical protein